MTRIATQLNQIGVGLALLQDSGATHQVDSTFPNFIAARSPELLAIPAAICCRCKNLIVPGSDLIERKSG